MKFTREQSADNTVSRYDERSVVVTGITYTRSLIVCPARVVSDWTHPAVGQLDVADVQPALDLKPELIVLGTGRSHAFPSTALLAAMAALGVGFEAMATRAACRTYNVLAQEGRNVVAALILD